MTAVRDAPLGAAVGSGGDRRQSPRTMALAALQRSRGSVPLRQLPTVVSFVVAMAVIAFLPGVHVAHRPSVIASIAIEAVATVLALALAHRPGTDRPTGDPVALVVPVLSLLAIGLLRVGTGGVESLFTPMLILPIVWIAAEPGRRHVLLATVMSSLALAMPYLVGQTGGDDGRGPWRAVYGPFVYALAALTINELARQVRLQLGELQASEIRLRAADRLTRSVLDAVTEQAVIGTDRAGLIDVWNPGAARMLGLGPAQAQGYRNVTEFFLPSELAERRRLIDPSGGAPEFAALVAPVSPGAAEVREWTWVRTDGDQVPVLVAVTARQDETERTVGYIFVAADQTQAHEAARVKDEFVGMISHELRTPVSAILGYLELLRDDPLTEDQRQYIGVAERNSHRLLRLVNDLLFTAQVDAGGLPIDQADVDLGEIVAASVQSATPAAVRAGVDLVAEVPPVSPHVTGDAGRLGQACDNLVSNALKFTPHGGTVTVRLTTEGDDVQLSVADTGIGVPADELARLFGRFFRASTAVRNAVPGVGLGLTITRAIVTAHGGTMDVASTEGVGTTFTARLPIGAAPAEAGPGSAGADTAGAAGESAVV